MMKFVAIGKIGFAGLAGAALVPFLPVVAMIVPVRDPANAVLSLVL